MKKKIRKDIIIVIVEIIAVVIIVFIAMIYRANYKRDKNLQDILYNDSMHVVSEKEVTKEIEYNVTDKNNLSISNIYQNEVTGVLQVRFQVLNTLPFVHDEITAKIALTGDGDTDYADKCTSFPVRHLHKNGMEYVITLENEDIPENDEELTLKIEFSDGDKEPYGTAALSFKIKSEK